MKVKSFTSTNLSPNWLLRKSGHTAHTSSDLKFSHCAYKSNVFLVKNFNLAFLLLLKVNLKIIQRWLPSFFFKYGIYQLTKIVGLKYFLGSRYIYNVFIESSQSSPSRVTRYNRISIYSCTRYTSHYVLSWVFPLKHYHYWFWFVIIVLRGREGFLFSAIVGGHKPFLCCLKYCLL